MNQEILSFTPKGKINLPYSKSYAHRILISAFIANKGANIINISLCDDVKCTLNALKVLGACFDIKENEIIFYPRKNELLNDLVIDVGESASTLRFLLPLVSYLSPHCKFIGKENLFSRPLSVYEDILNKQNIKYIKTKNSFEIFSSFKIDDFQIKCNISSQFVTGILFLLAYEQTNHYIKLIPPIESLSYIQMTIDVLKKFGVRFILKDYLIVLNFVHFNYMYYKNEIDFSQFAFFAVLGSIKGSVCCKNIDLHSLQGDKYIIDILMDMGAKIDFFGEELTFAHSLLKGREIDLANIIDLGPIIFVLASYCYGKTKLVNVKRLEYKESNRLKNMIKELKKAGVDITYEDNSVIINGKSNYEGNFVFESYNDHRIAMALSIFSVLCNGHHIIIDSECVNKSYPNFYQDLFSLKEEERCKTQ